MDQFMKLPPGQKAAVLAAILAVMGLGMYFLFVDPQVGRAEKATADLKKVQKELTDLKSQANPQDLAKAHKERDELDEKNKEAKKMLPSTDEVPNFIDSVQGDALRVGLRIRKFERLGEESQDSYNSIPIRMVVEGKFLDIVNFLRTYAGPDRRVMHVRDLTLEVINADAETMKSKLAAARGELGTGTDRAAAKSPEQLLANAIQVADLSRDLSTVRATFTAYAFVWTGKPKVGNDKLDKRVKKRT